ncbi:MAG: hypothetical protein KKF20_02705 [Bacteroidetes bacterium]|nr:hypothetical protein [Bacteroidota bacterium]MBU2471300.1 hypothetical protein [Bacteroidota bacterium]MBU2637129.1 hypothetical protein [Bacteroidota bacterium]
METLFWVLLVLQAVISGFLSMDIAEKKGHSSGAWFACGFFFGVLGLIAAAGLPIKQSATPAGASFLKKCPKCAEPIRKEALVCKYCANTFSKEQVIAELVASLQEKSVDTRLQALEALRTTSDSSVLPHLVRVLDDAGSQIKNPLDPAVRVLNKAAQLLEEFGGDSVSSQLFTILKRGGSPIKMNRIIEILGKLRDPSAIPILIGSLQNSQVSTVAAKSLEKFGNVAIPDLQEFTNQAKRSERKLAEQIIARIKQAPSA